MLPSVKEGLLLLPPLPMVVIQLLRDSGSKSTASSVAEVASSDPSLAASLLRTANSASMGLSRSITSVSEAVSYLGFGTVKAMVIHLRLDEVLAPKDPAAAIDAEDFMGPLAGRFLRRRIVRAVGSAGLNAGFVRDAGTLARSRQARRPGSSFRRKRPSFAGCIPTVKQAGSREAQVLGLDHAGIGANLAAKWKLPADLVQAIRWHHRPAGAFAPADPLPLRKALHIMQIANQLVKYCYSHTDCMEIDAVAPEAFELLNLDPSLSKLLEKPCATR